MLKQNKKNNTGFTLIEALISIAIFSIVLTLSSYATNSIFEINRRNESLNKTLDSFDQTFSLMMKEIRYGNSYTLGDWDNCNQSFSFNSAFRGGKQVVFMYNPAEKAIMRSIDGGSGERITPPNINIGSVCFYGYDGSRPMITVSVGAKVLGNNKQLNDFTIESSATQRSPEN